MCTGSLFLIPVRTPRKYTIWKCGLKKKSKQAHSTYTCTSTAQLHAERNIKFVVVAFNDVNSSDTMDEIERDGHSFGYVGSLRIRKERTKNKKSKKKPNKNVNARVNRTGVVPIAYPFELHRH